MRFNSVVWLIPLIETENDLNDLIKVDGVKRKIFAEKKSVRQSEFYQAAAVGFKPEITFQVWSREYKNEERLEYLDKVYSIMRSYEKGEVTELICTGGVHHGHA